MTALVQVLLIFPEVYRLIHTNSRLKSALNNLTSIACQGQPEIASNLPGLRPESEFLSFSLLYRANAELMYALICVADIHDSLIMALSDHGTRHIIEI